MTIITEYLTAMDKNRDEKIAERIKAENDHIATLTKNAEINFKLDMNWILDKTSSKIIDTTRFKFDYYKLAAGIYTCGSQYPFYLKEFRRVLQEAATEEPRFEYEIIKDCNGFTLYIKISLLKMINEESKDISSFSRDLKQE